MSRYWECPLTESTVTVLMSGGCSTAALGGTAGVGVAGVGVARESMTGVAGAGPDDEDELHQ